MTSRTGKPVVIANYDPAWPERFEEERALILGTCGGGAFVRIEHMGSTAVRGLAAKPVIDMMPGLRSLDDAPPLVPALESLGYEYVPEYEQPNLFDEGMPFRRYFRRDIGGVRAFQLHMVETNSEFWRAQILFRNYLRSFPLEAAAYAELKRCLAASFNETLTAESNINLGYTDRKSEFIEGILAKARARIAAGTQIVISDYDTDWPRRFERQRAAILEAAGDVVVGIEHVGSTSVPGLAAKPTVDIALGVRTMERGRQAIPALGRVGFVKRDEEDGFDDWTVFYKRDGAEAYHLHMVPYDGVRWRRDLAFRDYLRAHPETAAEYAALKRGLAAEYGSDRLGYPQAKSDFVNQIVRLALPAETA